jgi:hypothetical protein
MTAMLGGAGSGFRWLAGMVSDPENRSRRAPVAKRPHVAGINVQKASIEIEAAASGAEAVSRCPDVIPLFARKHHFSAEIAAKCSWGRPSAPSPEAGG